MDEVILKKTSVSVWPRTPCVGMHLGGQLSWFTWNEGLSGLQWESPTQLGMSWLPSTHPPSQSRRGSSPVLTKEKTTAVMADYSGLRAFWEFSPLTISAILKSCSCMYLPFPCPDRFMLTSPAFLNGFLASSLAPTLSSDLFYVIWFLFLGSTVIWPCKVFFFFS